MADRRNARANSGLGVSRRNLIAGAMGTAGVGVAMMTSQGKAIAQEAQTQAVGSPRVLSDKVAIITGARANLGRGYAVGLAEMGASILVHYHRESTRAQAEETGNLCLEAGAPDVAYAVGDLGKVENVRTMFDIAQSELGGADILVNNAGEIVKKPIAETTDEEYELCYNINSKGTFYCMREAANRLRNNGRIINMVTALVPSLTANYGVYAASKAANAQLVRTLANEIGGPDRGITVNSIHPGPVDTDFYREPESDGAIEYATQLAVANRLGCISDVVPLVQFVASPQSQWITGESLFVTGGYTQA